MPPAASRRPGPAPGQVAAASPLPLLLLLLACCAGACRIDDACSSFLPVDSQPQASKVLEELCFVLTGILLKPREQDEKDNTKRFLFHYSKTQKLGNSNVVEEFQTPFASRSRGYFLFRPRNGRRSAGFI
uniref:Neuromedin U n=1 Tax=Propithecus coquereli TaxID=379532 RepID=A0A2K6ENG6_PROCO